MRAPSHEPHAAVVTMAALALAACGGSSSGETSSQTATKAAGSSESEGTDLTGCLVAAGFTEPDTFTATVEIDGAEKVATVAFPPPQGEDDFLVVYEAGSASEAKMLAESFTGGPFAEAVGSMIYTVAGANDPLSAAQTEDVEACLRSQ